MPLRSDQNTTRPLADTRSGRQLLEDELLLEADEVARIIRIPAAAVRDLNRRRALVGVNVSGLKRVPWTSASVRAFVESLDGEDRD